MDSLGRKGWPHEHHNHGGAVLFQAQAHPLNLNVKRAAIIWMSHGACANIQPRRIENPSCFSRILGPCVRSTVSQCP